MTMTYDKKREKTGQLEKIFMKILGRMSSAGPFSQPKIGGRVPLQFSLRDLGLSPTFRNKNGEGEAWLGHVSTVEQIETR